MSFKRWEEEMGPAERYHRKLLFLAEQQELATEEDEARRRKWLAELEPPRPEDFRFTS